MLVKIESKERERATNLNLISADNTAGSRGQGGEWAQLQPKLNCKFSVVKNFIVEFFLTGNVVKLANSPSMNKLSRFGEIESL